MRGRAMLCLLGMAISYERPMVGYTAVMPTLSWRDEHSQVGEGEGEGEGGKKKLHCMRGG